MHEETHPVQNLFEIFSSSLNDFVITQLFITFFCCISYLLVEHLMKAYNEMYSTVVKCNNKEGSDRLVSKRKSAVFRLKINQKIIKILI